MELVAEASAITRSRFNGGMNFSFFKIGNSQLRLSTSNTSYPRVLRYPNRITKNRIDPCIQRNNFFCKSRFREGEMLNSMLGKEVNKVGDSIGNQKLEFLLRVLLKRGLILGAMVCGIFVLNCERVLAMEGVINMGRRVLEERLKGALPKLMQVLCVFKEQGLLLAALLSLSAFFSMAETSITMLWPWKVRELAEKEPDNGVFKMLRSDVTRFLTTILIGTTVVNIAATALVTEAATSIFGEAGVSAATGVMTVAILLLTEITPKSIAVHHATEVARFVVRPVAWLSIILYPVGRVVTVISMGILKILGLKGRSFTRDISSFP